MIELQSLRVVALKLIALWRPHNTIKCSKTFADKEHMENISHFFRTQFNVLSKTFNATTIVVSHYRLENIYQINADGYNNPVDKLQLSLERNELCLEGSLRSLSLTLLHQN